MIGFREIVKQLTTRFVYKVKVKQSYDDLTFEFHDMEEAATFAQTCLEKIINTHKEGDETQVTIVCDKIEIKLNRDEEKVQEEKAENTEEPVDADTEKEETES